MNQFTPQKHDPTDRTKLCARCGLVHQTADFYKNRRNGDGLDSWCKPCRRAYMAAWHDQRPNYDRAYYHKALKGNPEYREKRREWWAKMVATNRNFVRRNRERSRQRFLLNPEKRTPRPSQKSTADSRKYRARLPLVYRAHSAVTVAVRNGTLPQIKNQTCCRCGDSAAHYHHHLGYAPEHHLDVIPLCANCHGLTHRKP